MKVLDRKRKLKIVLIAVVVCAGPMSIVLGADSLINQVGSGVVRGTRELRDHACIHRPRLGTAPA